MAMNKNVTTITRFVAAALLAASAAACETQKSRTPTSPNVAGPIAGVNITAPTPTSPANGAEVVNTEPLRLVFGNAASNSERSFWYVVEMATDPAFNQKVYTNPRVTPASGQQTTLVVDQTFTAESTYFWRVKADDGANASEFSASAYFDLVVPVVIDPPVPVSPVNGQTTGSNTPELVVANGKVAGRAGSVDYRFEMARDGAFIDVVSVASVTRSDGDRTTHRAAALPTGALLYWRVTGTNGIVTSVPSQVQSFRTPAAPSPPSPPSPSPPPGGGGGPCISSSPQSIVECERAKYGHMSTGQLVEFLRAVARSLNANGISGRPFGILRKGGGHNCNGYSCDIVCSGQGGGQAQWDVLGDADGSQYPTWIGPNTVPNIRVDVCEIQ